MGNPVVLVLGIALAGCTGCMAVGRAPRTTAPPSPSSSPSTSPPSSPSGPSERAGPAASADPCWKAFLSGLDRCADQFAVPPAETGDARASREILLQGCVDGANLTLKTCYAQAPQDVPQDKASPAPAGR